MIQKKSIFYLLVFGLTSLLLSSCTSSRGISKGNRLPPFSGQAWKVDSRNGNAKSSSGLELGFGFRWMVTDTVLLQNQEQISSYPKFKNFLAKALRNFPEIVVDSIYFYNLSRGLLFVEYHQVKPLKPTAEVFLHDDSIPVYSKEYARIFGVQYTYIEDSGCENGPENSVYSNLHYSKKDRQFILHQRIPYKERNIAVFHIHTTIPKKGKWWEEYPYCIFWRPDLGSYDNLEFISSYLHNATTVAAENLQLSKSSE
ncbi:MAG: hypothetical protein K2L45_12505 [Muribaculaceae bacterium]|nr:hypothetical protein [Muribaculaceae bacterium]